MATSKQRIIRDIEDYIRKGGVGYAAWYVGISRNAKNRLNQHGICKDDWWICRTTTSAAVAREIEEYFLKKGTDGGPGGGATSADTVYVYKKAPHTDP